MNKAVKHPLNELESLYKDATGVFLNYFNASDGKFDRLGLITCNAA